VSIILNEFKSLKIGNHVSLLRGSTNGFKSMKPHENVSTSTKDLLEKIIKSE
jgi:hypothetical protein